ncbi:MAG: S1 RNA-binding domain-containing protein, partial [Puniceicoccales bacterium]|nr:S1 RNA-binding domain-containing protein [Puniceicoccales bacterium]
TNVTAFGAFVDIGVHQDGLVHISQLSDNFVKDPAEVVKVGQKVSVIVMEVDIPRKRIGLSMKTNPQKEARGIGAVGAGNNGTGRPFNRSGNGTGGGGNGGNGNARGASFNNNPFGSLGDLFKR